MRWSALHVLDPLVLRAPFLAQPVMAGNEGVYPGRNHTVEARSTKTLQEVTATVGLAETTGTGP